MNDECGRLLIKTSVAPMAIITSTARYEGMNARLWVVAARGTRFISVPFSFLHRAGAPWLIRQRINDVASRKPEPGRDGPARILETVSRHDRHRSAGVRQGLQSRRTTLREGLGRCVQKDR